MRDIVILGAGGFAREVAFLIEEINRVSATWRMLGFVEADAQQVGKQVGRYSVIYTEDELLDREIAAVIGIGNPAIIQGIADRFEGRPNVSFPNLIHPTTVWDQDRVVFERGNIVCAGNVFTTDIQIGSFNVFNMNCTWSHDIQIANCCVFNPGAIISGGVKIGSGCMLGTGSAVLQYQTIGDQSTVGAGAVVIGDVPPGTTVVGVPAKPLVKR